MDNTVTLVGLDFGTTTSSAVVATASLICNSVTRRTELRNIQPRYDSEQVFTPYCGDLLDEERLTDYLNQWLAEVRATDVFGGGAMITGLAAQATNAAAFSTQIRKRLKDAVIAIAADPCLESWLAFMGNCQELSRAHPDRALINLDIGGGTTNVALGRNGEVLRTGSFFVGARHIQFQPGGYRITALSSFARPLLDRLEINKGVGHTLNELEVQSIVDWYLGLLESAVRGSSTSEIDLVAALHTQSPFHPGPETNNYAITLSGGVGELAYRGLTNNTWPTTTAYGDLGIDLARQLVERPFWRDHLTRFTPIALGRATLFGLLRHNTQISGGTVYWTDPSVLPLGDLAIIGTISPLTVLDEFDRLIALVARTVNGACLRVENAACDRASLLVLAERLRQSLARQSTIHHIPLVLLVRENLGKVLGQLVTNWGRSGVKLAVIDEVDARSAQFASVGRLHDGVLPVSFHGMNASGESA
jgi:ethanolamine utilization protein EutA